MNRHINVAGTKIASNWQRTFGPRYFLWDEAQTRKIRYLFNAHFVSNAPKIYKSDATTESLDPFVIGHTGAPHTTTTPVIEEENDNPSTPENKGKRRQEIGPSSCYVLPGKP
jgi:hypothetical protein